MGLLPFQDTLTKLVMGEPGGELGLCVGSWSVIFRTYSTQYIKCIYIYTYTECIVVCICVDIDIYIYMHILS